MYNTDGMTIKYLVAPLLAPLSVHAVGPVVGLAVGLLLVFCQLWPIGELLSCD
jgi:hypothetical protein